MSSKSRKSFCQKGVVGSFWRYMSRVPEWTQTVRDKHRLVDQTHPKRVPSCFVGDQKLDQRDSIPNSSSCNDPTIVVPVSTSSSTRSSNITLVVSTLRTGIYCLHQSPCVLLLPCFLLLLPTTKVTAVVAALALAVAAVAAAVAAEDIPCLPLDLTAPFHLFQEQHQRLLEDPTSPRSNPNQPIKLVHPQKFTPKELFRHPGQYLDPTFS